MTGSRDATPAPFSDWALFATALLDSGDWERLGSHWINGGSPTGNAAGNSTDRKQLRAEFQVPAEVFSQIEHASLFWAAVGYGKLWLNGAEIGGGKALGPWMTWSERILYRCEDVTASLAPGANAIGVWLGSGQYDSHWTQAWCKRGCKPELGLRLLLRAALANGTTVTVAASAPAGWSAAASPFVSDDVYNGVHFDARLLADGFSTPGYKPPAAPGSWRPATPVPGAGSLFGRLTPHVFTPIRLVSERRPVRITRPAGANSTYVFWFADNSVGWAQLNDVVLPAGTTLKLAHAEQMRAPNGTVCLVGCETGSVFYGWGGAVDTYTLRGASESGPETYGAQFSYHGFQFVELTGWPSSAAPPTLDTVTAQVVHSDNKVIANLTFPDQGPAAVLNKINDNVVRSLLSNMHSVESDCPTRERVGWTGDSQATAETAVRNLDLLGFYAKWLQDYEDAQCPGKPGCPGGNDTGALSSTIPFAKHVPPVDPSWPSSYAQIAMLLYRYSGDDSVIRARYDSIKRYVDFMPTARACPSCKAPTNTVTTPPGHPELPWYYMNGDWMEYQDRNDEEAQSGPLLSSYHYILDVGLLGKMAQIIGNEADAGKYLAMEARLWPVFNAVYLSDSHRPPPPPPPPGCDPATTACTCAESKEIKKGGHDVQLGCGPAEEGGTIDRVVFAAFGTPTGSCSAGLGHSATCDDHGAALAAVEKSCLGRAECTLRPTLGPGGIIPSDPCPGIIKTLAVQVRCTKVLLPRPPGPPPSPAPGRPLFAYATPGTSAGQLEQVVMLGRPGLPVPAEHRHDVEQTLLRQIAEADNHITTGFIGNKYAWPALSAMGRADLALELAMGTSCPSYGYQIAQGATTLWENWSGTEVDSTAPMTGEGPSHNHHFMGGIGQWLQSDLVGLQQGRGTAFSHAVVMPQIVNHTDLPAAAGRWETPRGPVAVSWSFAAPPHLSLNVSMPPNTAATVVFPCRAATIQEGGVVVWQSGAAVAGVADGVKTASLQHGTGLVEFAVASGDYAFGGPCI